MPDLNMIGIASIVSKVKSTVRSSCGIAMRPSIALSAEFRSDLDAALLREIEDGDTRLEVGTDD